jgi:Ca-activated chloride channel family protein
MKFAAPWMFAFLLPLAFAAWRLLRRARRSGVRFSAVGRISSGAAGWRFWVSAAAPYALLAGLALLTVAAARPRSPVGAEKKTVDAIAIAMVVDISESMNALDLTPEGERPSLQTTRLAIVKKLFAEFVSKRPDDLIGLVTFGGYASTRSPLTADHDALLHVLKGVEIPPGVVEEERMTAIGDGLATAVARLKDAKPKSKVAILLSDGVKTAGAVEPADAAEAARKLGIKVYSIGVGSRSRNTPYLQNVFGGQAIGYADMTFDEEQLKSIAATTGGMYFSVNDRDSLAKALEEIDKLETTSIEADVYGRWNEHFRIFLLAGSLLVLVAASLSMASIRRLA